MFTNFNSQILGYAAHIQGTLSVLHSQPWINRLQEKVKIWIIYWKTLKGSDNIPVSVCNKGKLGRELRVSSCTRLRWFLSERQPRVCLKHTRNSFRFFKDSFKKANGWKGICKKLVFYWERLPPAGQLLLCSHLQAVSFKDAHTTWSSAPDLE